MPEIAPDHKERMQAARRETITVRAYLKALAAKKEQGGPGRKRTPESMQARVEAIDLELDKISDPVTKLLRIQERRNLVRELEGRDEADRLQELEDDFVKIAGSFSERRAIEYEAWREMGVEAAVLKRAGITR